MVPRRLDELRADVGISLRALRCNSGFALVAVLTIAVAIGANSALFGVVRAVLLKPLPYADPQALSIVWNDFGRGQSLPAVSGSDFLDYRKRAGALAEFGAASSGRGNLHGAEGDPEMVEIGTATATFFPLLGVKPVIGQLFTPPEAGPNGPKVVLL